MVTNLPNWSLLMLIVVENNFKVGSIVPSTSMHWIRVPFRPTNTLVIDNVDTSGTAPWSEDFEMSMSVSFIVKVSAMLVTQFVENRHVIDVGPWL